MIDIDKLEALAKAAADHGENIGEESWYVEEEFVCNMLMHPIDANFAEACTPAAILALIAEVRALREDLQAGKILAHANVEMSKAEKADNERLAAQFAELEAVARDAVASAGHWKANHDNQVARARFLIERADIPLERVRAYEYMAALQAFHNFFRDRCAGLLAQFGMPAVDAYNKAAGAREKS